MLFRPSGPLGQFSNKISLAFLMGVLDEEAYKDIVTIKDIRNDFAHRLDIENFQTPTIRDRCLNLKMVETYVGHADGTKGDKLLDLKKSAKPWVFTQEYARKLSDARARYMMSAALFTLYFTNMESPGSYQLIFVATGQGSLAP